MVKVPLVLRRLHAGSAFGLYLLVTIVMGFPLVRRIATLLPSDLGDPVLNTWILWWHTRAVPFTDAWWNAPAFYPAPDVLTYSEHLLGLSLFSAPVQWLTGNPVAAYNLTFLLTFPLCGLAAFLLAREITGRADAAWLAGLAFAFSPYRMDQLAHIQVLASFWMPLGLFALHRYYRDDRPRWLALFALTTLMQGLSNGYYLLFYPVLVGLWTLWFTPAERWWRQVGTVGAAGLAGVLPLVPVLLRYRSVHDALGFARGAEEIAGYSADMGGVISASPHLVAWGFLDALRQPEGQLFPGLTVVVLTGLVLWRASWRPGGAESPLWRPTRWLLRSLALLLGLSLAARIAGVWPEAVSGILEPHLGSALLHVGLLALLSSRVVVAAYEGHAPLAFYLLATVALGLLALGPRPTLLGTEAIALAPYDALTYLPGFDGLRVPARFWMLATICLAAITGIAFAHLVPTGSRWRSLVLGVVTVGLLVDGWVRLPTVPAPRRSVVLERLAEGPVVELPLGWRDDDAAAMLRATYHGEAVVNGHSGYVASHYRALEYALGHGREDVLDLLASLGVRQIRINRDHPDGPTYESYVATWPGSRRMAETDHESLYAFTEVSPPPPPTPLGPRLEIAAVTANVNDELTGAVLDGDLKTRWHTGPQNPGYSITADLGASRLLGAVVAQLGGFTLDFPRRLRVAISDDGENWREVWRGPGDAVAVIGALREPREAPLVIPLTGARGRYVRLQQTSGDPTYYWSVAELRVHGP